MMRLMTPMMTSPMLRRPATLFLLLACWLHASPALRFAPRVGQLRLCADGSSSSFADLIPSLPAVVTLALSARGVTTPTPIQEAALARAFAGESLLLHAETGSGKSLAFLLPTLARLGLAGLVDVPTELTQAKVLIITPTRELGVQL